MTNLGIGLIGYAFMGAAHSQAWRSAPRFFDLPLDPAMNVLCGRNAEAVQAAATKLGWKDTETDWRKLLGRDDVQLVDVCTPGDSHAEIAIAALEAGKHVLCEKPMALDVAECERMRAAARAHGVRLGVAYYRHHYPIVGRLRALVAAGEIGAPVFASVQAFEHFDPGPDHPRAWLLRRSESGGGPMMDFGCHRIEVLLDVLGPVAEVSGFPVNAHLRNREVEDTCIARLGFRSGAQAVLTVSHATRESRDTIEIFGSAGSAHVPVLNQGRLRIVTAAGTREEDHPAPANLHQPLVADFVQAVHASRAPAVTGEIGQEVSRVLAAIYARA